MKTAERSIFIHSAFQLQRPLPACNQTQLDSAACVHGGSFRPRCALLIPGISLFQRLAKGAGVTVHTLGDTGQSRAPREQQT